MIVIAKYYGQLGNRLLLSAHLIAAAEEYGVTFYNPGFSEYAEFFPAIAGDVWCRYPSKSPSDELPVKAPSPRVRHLVYKWTNRSARWLTNLRLTRFPIKTIQLADGDSIDLGDESFRELANSQIPLFLSGYEFRSDRLLAKHADVVREHYRILPHHRDNVQEKIDLVRKGANRVIGVHIRRGDFETWNNGRHFYSVDQYVAMMRKTQKKLEGKNVSFLVCSNVDLDPQDFSGLNVHFGTGHLIEDMYAFAKTDLLIGPPSTFTSWASFYGKVPLQIMMNATDEIDLSSLEAIFPSSDAA